MTKDEVDKIYTAGEMWENSIQVYIKDYKKRVLTVFPNILKVKEVEANQNDYGEIETQTWRIQMSSENFRKNEEMPFKFKSHVLTLNKIASFYIRLHPKLSNFKKFVVLTPNPEDALFLYIKHTNLKQYLSGNNMFSILFSFIYSSRGNELMILSSLLHRNPFFLNLLFDLGGIDLLKDIIVDKQMNSNMDEEFLVFLFNIAWNEPISTRFDQRTESTELIPQLNESYMDFLDILMLIWKSKL